MFTSVLERMDRMEARLARVEARLGLAVEPPPADERPAGRDEPRPLVAKTPNEAPPAASTPALASAPASAAPPVAPLDTAAVAARLRAAALTSTPAAPAVPSSPPTPPESSFHASPTEPEAPSRALPSATTVTERRAISWRRRRESEPPERRDLERFVGVSILGRVGVAALLLAAAYFAQWTYQRIGPVARVASIYGLSALLVGAGILLRAKVSRTYLGILWGGGVAAAYMAGFVARVHFALVGPVAATAMLAGACALGQALAARARMQALAILAIVGAAAAPVLVGSPDDARTSLLVYLLAVHGWGAFVERRWGWTAARGAALASTAAVALLWLGAHGGADVSTYVHAHLYLLGWTAPEWMEALSGREPTRARAMGTWLLVSAAEAWAYVFAVSAGDEALHRGFAVAAAGLWGTVALTSRVGTGQAGGYVRGLARVAGLLLVLGGLTVLDAYALSGVVRERWALAGVAAAGLVALSGRRLFGVGDGAATLSAVLGLAVVGTMSRATPDPWCFLGLVVPAALFLSGSAAGWRVSGLLVASAAPFLATSVADGRDPWWLAAAYGGSAAIAALSHARAARRADAACALAAGIVLGALALGWTVAAESGVFLAVPRPFANAGSLAAAFVVAALATASGRRIPGRGGSDPRLLVSIAGLSLLLAAIWREVHAWASQMSSADLGRVVETATLSLYGTAIAAVGRSPGRRLLLVGGFVVLGLAALNAFDSVGAAGGPWTAAAQVLLLAAPAVFIASRDARPETLGTATALLLAAGAAWSFAWGAGRFDALPLLVNGRLLSGAAVVVGLVFLHRASLRGGPAALVPLLAVVATLLSFVVGLGEVLGALSAVHHGPWRRVLVSVYATLHGAVVLAIGFRTRDALLRWLAIGAFGAVALKVALFDLESVPTELRILVTACLGAVLLAAAYAYARRSPGPALAAASGPPADAEGPHSS